MALRAQLADQGLEGDEERFTIIHEFLLRHQFFSVNDLRGASGLEELEGYDDLEVRTLQAVIPTALLCVSVVRTNMA